MGESANYIYKIEVEIESNEVVWWNETEIIHEMNNPLIT